MYSWVMMTYLKNTKILGIHKYLYLLNSIRIDKNFIISKAMFGGIEFPCTSRNFMPFPRNLSHPCRTQTNILVKNEDPFPGTIAAPQGVWLWSLEKLSGESSSPFEACLITPWVSMRLLHSFKQEIGFHRIEIAWKHIMKVGLGFASQFQKKWDQNLGIWIQGFVPMSAQHNTEFQPKFQVGVLVIERVLVF